MNKSKQKLTKPRINPLTGLTPIQEQCASLLASGERVSAVAEKVQVSRTTIYLWSDTITFQCFMNQLRDEVQRHMNQTLFGMTEEALGAIRQTLTSDNESLKLKVAMWLVDRMSSMEVGKCNPFKAIEEESTYVTLDNGDTPEFHPSVYKQKLKDLGLVDPQINNGRKSSVDLYDD